MAIGDISAVMTIPYPTTLTFVAGGAPGGIGDDTPGHANAGVTGVDAGETHGQIGEDRPGGFGSGATGTVT